MDIMIVEDVEEEPHPLLSHPLDESQPHPLDVPQEVVHKVDSIIESLEKKDQSQWTPEEQVHVHVISYCSRLYIYLN